MEKFTNPLKNIHIASPCAANWNEMYGDHRKRFCGDCKLNVYNLSDMSRNEAESFLINSEGRVCVRFYRRNDGTILTKDCPVGWQAVKRRVSKISAAVFSMIIGVFSGIFAFTQLNSTKSAEVGKLQIEKTDDKAIGNVYVPGKSDPNVVMGNYTMGAPLRNNQTKTDDKKTRK